MAALTLAWLESAAGGVARVVPGASASLGPDILLRDSFAGDFLPAGLLLGRTGMGEMLQPAATSANEVDVSHAAVEQYVRHANTNTTRAAHSN